MNVIGVFAIVAGGLVFLVAAGFSLATGTAALTGLPIGMIAMLCGAICIILDAVLRRLRALESKVDELIKSQRTASGEAAAERIIEQLRREGLLRSGTGLTEKEISDMIE